MRRRIILKPNDLEQEQLAFICSTLRVDPRDFMLSLIPVHAAELSRMMRERATAPAPSMQNHVLATEVPSANDQPSEDSP